LNGIDQLCGHADDVNLLGDNINTIKRNMGAPVHASRLVGLEADTEKLGTCPCLHQKVEQYNNTKTANRACENVTKFRGFRMMLTN
jgi:hypothetical protein